MSISAKKRAVRKWSTIYVKSMQSGEDMHDVNTTYFRPDTPKLSNSHLSQKSAKNVVTSKQVLFKETEW